MLQIKNEPDLKRSAIISFKKKVLGDTVFKPTLPYVIVGGN